MIANSDFLKHQKIKILIFLSIQSILVLLSISLTFLVVNDFSINKNVIDVIIGITPVFILTKITVFYFLGLSYGWWRYVSIPDVLLILKANAIGTFVLIMVLVFSGLIQHVSRSIIFLDLIFCFIFMIGIRVVTRIGLESFTLNRKHKNPRHQHVVVVGAGATGQMIAREIHQNPRIERHLVGFIDEDPERQKYSFQGVPVLGTLADLSLVCRSHHVDQVIIAQPAVSPAELRMILDVCRSARVQSKILPAMGDIITGGASVQQIRDVALEDLLGRKPIHLDVDNIKSFLCGKKILITGAGGSIGSEICRQICSYAPAGVLLLDQAETPLFHIENELRERYAHLDLHPSLTDIRDKDHTGKVFNLFQPDVVFHAAAYKHVPMMERNPLEAVRNNIIGTRIVADASHACGAQYFVMVSTDKAVRPANAMGASKRAAEIYVQSLAQRSKTHFVTVRFGNVLGSNGSVVPIFQEQIRKGGPITVTHPEVTRFFMTIPEAVQLVLQAGTMGKGGEIFLLEMGEPMRILDLAEELIRLSGFRPYNDINIVFTGLRAGEKLFEELLLPGEGVMPTSHEKIRVARALACDPDAFFWKLENLEQALGNIDSSQVLAHLKKLVPEYHANQESKETPPVATYSATKIAAGPLLAVVRP